MVDLGRRRRERTLRRALILACAAVAFGAGSALAGPVLDATGPIRFKSVIGSFDDDYGNAPGYPQYATAYVRNAGDADLVIATLATSSTDPVLVAFGDFANASCAGSPVCDGPFTVPPNGELYVELQCTPSEIGTFAAALAITSNAPGGVATVPMECVGTRPPVVALSPTALDFGTVRACDPVFGSCANDCATRPLQQSLTISNAAAPPSRLGFRLTPQLAAADDFTVAGPICDADWYCSLESGESLTFDLSFHPRHTVLYDDLALETDYPGFGPVPVPFFAQGGYGAPAYDATVHLGDGPTGDPILAPVTLRNVGNSCLHVSEVSFLGDPNIELVGGPPSQFTLAAGESYAFTVSCKPTVPHGTWGSFDYRFEGGDITGSQLVYCTGHGAAIAGEPDYLSFYGTPIGTAQTTRVTVRNVGDAAGELVGFGPPDPQLSAAVVGAALPVTLAPGASVDVDVTFAPTRISSFNTYFMVDLATGGDLALPLSADSVVLSGAVAPAAHDFGAIAATDAPVQPFQLANTGTTTLVVRGVTLDAPADFSVAGLDAVTSIPVGQSRAFTVAATPTMLGARAATLSLALDPVAPLTVPLAFLATDPALEVTTADASPSDYALDFGAVDVDTGPRTATVSLHNAGTAPIELTACALTGDPELSLTTACPLAIPPGATATLALAFAPTAEALSAATLEVAGTGFATGALRLAVRGTGIDQHVELSALAVDFGDAYRRPLAPTARTVTLRNTADAPLDLALAVDGAGFELAGPAAAALAPGATVDIALRFAPAALGAAAGQLLLGNADDPQLARVALTGHAIARTVDVSPLALDLGAVTAGTTLRLPGALTLTSAAAFELTGASLAGDPAFRLLGPDRAHLAPGAPVSLDLELVAAAPGRRAATLSLFLDGDSEPHARVALTALVVAPASSGCAAAPADSLGLTLLAALVALLIRRRRPPRTIP